MTHYEGLILDHLLDNDRITSRGRLIELLFGSNIGPSSRGMVASYLRSLQYKLQPGWEIRRAPDKSIIMLERDSTSSRVNRPYLLRHITNKPLGRVEAIVLRDLLDNDGITTLNRLIDQIYGDDPDGGPLFASNCVWHRIYNLRRKLVPGWRIFCVYNQTIRLEETVEI